MDKNEIAEMARIMAAMNAAPVADEFDTANTGEPIYEGISPPPVLSDPNVDAMRNILLMMNSAGQAVSNIQESAKTDLDLRAALATRATPKGSQIGSWDIVKHDNMFDLVHTATSEPIAKDLMLYEAAVSLARTLNEGVSITDKRVRDILKLEEDYVRNRNNAASFKRTAKAAVAKGDETKAAIAEDRFDEAAAKAIDAHDRILRLAGLR